MMASIPLPDGFGDAFKEIVKSVVIQGAFSTGAVCGALFTVGLVSLLNKGINAEHTKRLQLVQEREKELHDQLNKKEERIEALHKRIEELSSKPKK